MNFFRKKSEKSADIPAIEIKEIAPGSGLQDDLEPLWVDFRYGDDEEKGIRSAGVETFVISPLVEENLFSNKYVNCTGTIGVGRDKVTGKEIAFLSHQDPEYLLHQKPENSEIFLDELNISLKELVDRSEAGTVEVAIFGGNYDPTDLSSKKSSDYSVVMEMLKDTIKGTVGISPTTIRGPNTELAAIDVTFITQERKMIVE